MLSFRKKLMNQSRENLRTDARTEARMEGRPHSQTLFYRTLPTEAGGTKVKRFPKYMVCDMKLRNSFISFNSVLKNLKNSYFWSSSPKI